MIKLIFEIKNITNDCQITYKTKGFFLVKPVAMDFTEIVVRSVASVYIWSAIKLMGIVHLVVKTAIGEHCVTKVVCTNDFKGFNYLFILYWRTFLLLIYLHIYKAFFPNN